MQTKTTRKRASEVVYFVQGETTRLIKIGVTYAPLRRLQQLKTGATEPLILVGVIRRENPEELERELHRRFSYAHERLEWFKPVEALVAFIARHAFTLEEDEEIRRALLTQHISPALRGRTMAERIRPYKEAHGLA